MRTAAAQSPGSRIVKAQNLGESPEEQRKSQLIKYLQRVASAPQNILQAIICQSFWLLRIRGNFQAIRRLTPALAPDCARSQGTASTRLVVKPVLEAARGAALQRIEQLLGEKDPRATTDAGNIVTAARDGRIDTLFLTDSADSSDRYDDRTNRAIDQQQDIEDEDLLNYSAAQTLLHKGHVMTMPKGVIAGSAAALLRY